MMALRVVLLPTPLRPRSHHLPFPHLEGDAVQNMALAIVAVDVFDLDEGDLDEGLDGGIARAHVLR